jgi:DNA-directed RNA polymerase specialized sigma24 family protein
MEIDELVRRTVAGDGAAWRSLSERVVPEIQRMARAHSGLRGRNLGTADEIAEVLTAALERLARDNYRNLSRYLAQRKLASPQSFDSWLYGAVDFTVREHLRVRFGRVQRQGLTGAAQPQPSKRDLASQAERVDEDRLRHSVARALSITDELELAKLVEYMNANFAPQELLAMRLYYGEDKSLPELALLLDLEDESAANKLLRRLNARLRHRFASAAPE